ncbi:MAG: rhomboid family intramembrane serine protease [Pseudomonadota bacterium]
MRRQGFVAWALVALLLGGPAAWLGWTEPATQTAWLLHPSAGLTHNPIYSYWTCAWVHSNAQHLRLNLAGLILLLGLAWVFKLPTRAALAWLAAWPLTHLALLLDPRLESYWGLSGVLHAGMAVIATTLIVARPTDNIPPPRALGWVLMIGLIAKSWMENPHLAAIVHRPELSMNVAPLSHLAGITTGSLLALALCMPRHLRQSPT